MSSDPQVQAGLALCLEHAAPFEVAEVASLEVVVVSNAVDLAWLRHCRSARQLVLMGCEVGHVFADKTSIEALPELRRLDLSFSSVVDIPGVAGHPRLQDVSLMDSLVTAASPLLALPMRRHINLVGCPLSEESYFDVVPRLTAEPAEDTGKPPKKVKVSPEPDWRLTLLIQSRGIRAVYSQGKALAPGLAYSDMPDLHSYTVSHDDVKRVLDQVEDGDLKGFMDRCKQIAFSR